MTGDHVPVLGCGRAEIGKEKDAKGGGETEVRALGARDEGAELVDVELFSVSDFGQRGPHEGFQADRCAPVSDFDVPEGEAAAGTVRVGRGKSGLCHGRAWLGSGLRRRWRSRRRGDFAGRDTGFRSSL